MTTIQEWIQLYLTEKKQILDQLPVSEIAKLTEWVIETYEKGSTIFAMGNGGNAGTVDHIYCDFKHHPFVSEDKQSGISGKVKRLHFINLCGSASELTGLVNDLGVEEMFAAALLPDVKPGDLVMGFSGSGNSKNVIKAFECARAHDARTVAITKGDGGKCKSAADLCIVIPGTSKFPGQTGKNDNNFHFEDAVLYINSMVVGILKHHVYQKLSTHYDLT